MVAVPTARNKAIDRVRKFLAIAERTTTPLHEREAMRRQAKRLIAKHEIAEHETKIAPPQPPRPVRGPSTVITWIDLISDMVTVIEASNLAHEKRNRRPGR